MAEVCITTDRELEAIYEYSDNTPYNLAKTQPGQKVDIALFFNEGNRFIVIKDENKGTEEKYDLKDPKKPDDTGEIFLRLLSQHFKVNKEIAQQVAKLIPDVIEKVR